MPLEEPRHLVEGLVGLVQRSEVTLEDVRAFGGHLQRHLDVVPAGVHGQPDGVVQEHLVGAGLDQQRSVATASPPPAESPASRTRDGLAPDSSSPA